MHKSEIIARPAADRNFTPGATLIRGGIHICTAFEAENLSLLLYRKGEEAPEKLDFPAEGRIGNLWTMDLVGTGFRDCEYTLQADGREFADPFGACGSGAAAWGEEETAVRRSRFPVKGQEWKNDRRPARRLEDTVIYRLHVRGFSKGVTSVDAGTFRAVRAKIPYLKKLGVNAVELMPAYEFPEVVKTRQPEGGRYPVPEGPKKINYWGYAPGACYFAPKAAYAGTGRDPFREFCELVRALHRNDMELYMELYFPEGTPDQLILEAARFWVFACHVDGIHLSGPVSPQVLAQDPALAGIKLFAVNWPGHLLPALPAGSPAEKQAKAKRLAEYNDGFLTDMRRVLRGDENAMGALRFRSAHNPAACGTVNYMANTNGFTLADMVSYEQKHNEENGENGRDGNSENFTWNCGEEGPTAKRKILRVREQQLRNAVLLLFLSQGTPLLMAGDEFGNSQEGNNNAWCQDNETSWLDWKLLRKNRWLHDYIASVIGFRRAHPMFRLPKEPQNADYLSCGHPDVSYHGQSAWYPDPDGTSRQLGILYCGEYAKLPDGSPDDWFYVAYNMHWNPHEFGLPKLPDGYVWSKVIDTSAERLKGLVPEGQEKPLEDQKALEVPERAIVVLRGRMSAEKPAKRSAGRGGKKRPSARQAKAEEKGQSDSQRPLAPQGSTSPESLTGSPSSSD